MLSALNPDNVSACPCEEEVPPPDVGGMVSAVWGRRVRAVRSVRDARDKLSGEKNAENISKNVENQLKNAIFAG